jgi:probable rRNA maturation factor
MKLHFTLTQTPAARKRYAVGAKLKAALKSIALQVAQLELGVTIPALKEFTLSIVVMSDDELLELNRSVLYHDYYTDILTFELDRTAETLESELYFSVDRARENAQKAQVSLEKELALLTVHGVLHLAGYDDHEPAQKKRMILRQRFFLAQNRERIANAEADTNQRSQAKTVKPKPARATSVKATAAKKPTSKAARRPTKPTAKRPK